MDTIDLGKPAPSNGIIHVDFLPLMNVTLPPGVVFEARVTAVGPGRTGTTTLSNPFSFQPPCAPTISPTGQPIGFGGGTGSVGVTAASGCIWTAVSNATSWLTVTAGASGSGNGTVSFSAAPNPNASTRVGTIRIGGQTFTVPQAATRCTFSVAPTSQSVGAGGGTGATNLTTPTRCAWTAVTNATSWLPPGRVAATRGP